MTTDLDQLRGSRAGNTKLKRRISELEQLLDLARQQRRDAVRRANDAEAVSRDLRAELESLSAPEPHEAFPNIDPELVALRLLITRLRTEDHEAYAPGICWALNGVKTITAGLADATGQVRRIGRRAA